MNLSHLRFQLAQIRQSMRMQSQLLANFIDPISAMLRAQLASGNAPTSTTPERIESAKASLTTRLEEAGRNARARAWS